MEEITQKYSLRVGNLPRGIAVTFVCGRPIQNYFVTDCKSAGARNAPYNMMQRIESTGTASSLNVQKNCTGVAPCSRYIYHFTYPERPAIFCDFTAFAMSPAMTFAPPSLKCVRSVEPATAPAMW